jgi:hypothetical protein
MSTGASRTVVPSVAASSERTLVPGDDAQLGEIRFEDWLGQPALVK